MRARACRHRKPPHPRRACHGQDARTERAAGGGGGNHDLHRAAEGRRRGERGSRRLTRISLGVQRRVTEKAAIGDATQRCSPPRCRRCASRRGRRRLFSSAPFLGSPVSLLGRAVPLELRRRPRAGPTPRDACRDGGRRVVRAHSYLAAEPTGSLGWS
jgi:hypothetical protein